MLQCLEQKSLCLLPTSTVGISLQLYGESLILALCQTGLAKPHTKGRHPLVRVEQPHFSLHGVSEDVSGSHHPRNIQSVAMGAEFCRLPIRVNECSISTSGNDAHDVA
jgi:hypothetical protein